MFNWLRSLLNFSDAERGAGHWAEAWTPRGHAGEAPRNSSVALAATQLLSGTMSILPVGLYQRRDDGGREVVTRHPAAKVLRTPSRVTTWPAFIGTLTNHQVNKDGGGFAEIQRDMMGRPYALWPIHPSRVTIHEQAETTDDAEQGDLIYEVRNKHGEPTYLHQSDMLHVRGVYSDDAISSLGVPTMLRRDFEQADDMSEFAKNNLRNGSRPTAVLKKTKFKDADARAAFRKDWNSIHGGAAGAGGLAILEGDSELDTLGLSFEDQQFLDRQKNIDVAIARAYGIPQHMLGILDKSSFNNIATQSIEFTVYSLARWIVQWESELDRKLLTDTERERMYFKLNVNGLLRGDPQTRAAFYDHLVRLGALSSNDVRRLEDMNPVEGGDTYVFSAGGQPIPLTKLADWNPATPAPSEPPVVVNVMRDDSAAEENRKREQLAALFASRNSTAPHKRLILPEHK